MSVVNDYLILIFILDAFSAEPESWSVNSDLLGTSELLDSGEEGNKRGISFWQSSLWSIVLWSSTFLMEFSGVLAIVYEPCGCE